MKMAPPWIYIIQHRETKEVLDAVVNMDGLIEALARICRERAERVSRFNIVKVSPQDTRGCGMWDDGVTTYNAAELALYQNNKEQTDD